MVRQREYPLTLDEQDWIDGLEEDGYDASEIADQLRRLKRSVAYYLNHRQSHSEEDGDQPALRLYSARTYGG